MTAIGAGQTTAQPGLLAAGNASLATRLPPANRPPRRTLAGRSLSHAILFVFGVLFLAPLLWLFVASVDGQASWSIEWPHWTLGNFGDALSSTNLQVLLNSGVMSVVASAVATAAAVPAGYVLSRRRVPFKGPLLLAVLFLAGVPLAILIIPVYQMFARLGWLSLLPAALFLAVTSLPFEIYLIKNFIDSLPRELEEAARIERANTWQVLRHVVAPLALPGICAAAIFGFVAAWGSFIVPLVLILSPSQEVGSVAIYNFIGSDHVQYGDIAAFSLVFAVPVFVLYGFSSRLFREGFAFGGAVKG